MKYTRQMLTVLLLMTPLMAAAQLASNVKIATQVPFDFVVGDKVFPAGKCIVQAANAATDTILIRNKNTRTSLYSPTDAAEGAETAATDELVFHKYGDRYFLSTIRVEGTRIVYLLPESKEEAGLRMRNVPSGEKTIHAFLR